MSKMTFLMLVIGCSSNEAEMTQLILNDKLERIKHSIIGGQT